MFSIALKMLVGDRAKYLGLVFAIAFSSMLMAHQVSIFAGILRRTRSQIEGVRDAQVWVMDPRIQYFDEVEPMPDRELLRVRGVPGVAWAIPMFKQPARAKTAEGVFHAAFLMGHDDATLVGAPREFIVGKLEDLRESDAVIVDDIGYGMLWPGEPFGVGRVFEMNDHRAVVVGVVKGDPTFQTVPLISTRYSNALRFVGNERNTLSFILVKPEEGVGAKDLATRIHGATGLQALTRAEFGWKSIGYYMAHTGIPVNFGTTIAMAFIVGAVVAGQTFYLFTVENIRQFGALKAIGVTNGRLVAMILLQGVLVGIIGYAIGAGLASLFFFLTSSIPHLRGFFMPWQILLLTGGAVVLIIVLASLLSIRRVLVLEPAVVFKA
jgi:putative ABC transport system permease protein